MNATEQYFEVIVLFSVIWGMKFDFFLLILTSALMEVKGLSEVEITSALNERPG